MSKLFWDAVFFDLDNTLFDYEETFKRTSMFAFEELKGNFGWQINTENWFCHFKKYCDYFWQSYEEKEITREEYKQKRFLSSLKDFSMTAPASSAVQLQKLFDNKVAQFVVPNKGLHEVLKFLHQQNVLIGIITNGETAIQGRKIESLQIAEWISKKNIFISESVELEKPDPAFFYWVVSQLQPIHAPLYIGDSWHLDIIPAIEAGWDAGYVGTSWNKHTGVQPTFICSNIEDVLEQLITCVK